MRLLLRAFTYAVVYSPLPVWFAMFLVLNMPAAWKLCVASRCSPCGRLCTTFSRMRSPAAATKAFAQASRQVWPSLTYRSVSGSSPLTLGAELRGRASPRTFSLPPQLAQLGFYSHGVRGTTLLSATAEAGLE